MTPNTLYDAYIFDLDGTVYLGEALLPTAGETITQLRELGKRTVFLSNNPTKTREEYTAKLNRLGLPTAESDVINSSLVMVHFLQQHLPGAKLHVCGEQSLINELERAGFTITDQADEVDAVIASFDRTFVYHKLQVAFDAIRAGARFFATNGDRYCPVPGGGEPDAASIIAAIEACTATEVEAIVGKPSSFMAEAILNVLQLPPERCIMIGDRLETDVLMGLNAGMAAALTLTGATTAEAAAQSEIKPTFQIHELNDLLITNNQ
ncbi:MAG: HAD-IIA family hydrolase [Ardenticatenaceae bacterium]|nr:HAD-IIA family hydrolase [Ardenticatenaceae bacterium]